MQSIGGRKLDFEDESSLAENQVAGDQAGTTMDNLQVEDLDTTAHDGDMTENADPTGSSPTSPVLTKKVVLSATSRTKGNPTFKKVL